MSNISDKWLGNYYHTAKRYTEIDKDMKITERQAKTVLMHVKAISEAYVQLYEEKFGSSEDLEELEEQDNQEEQ